MISLTGLVRQYWITCHLVWCGFMLGIAVSGITPSPDTLASTWAYVEGLLLLVPLGTVSEWLRWVVLMIVVVPVLLGWINWLITGGETLWRRARA